MIRITRNQIVFGITGTIYEMHPYHNPQGMNKIMDAVNKWLDEKADCNGHNDTNFKMFEYEDYSAFVKELRSVLMGILEFRQLNISRKRYDMGVRDYNDERNQGFAISTRYDKDTLDERYDDFIDLDACICNIARAAKKSAEEDEDCFLCKYAEEYGSMSPSDCEACKICVLNPKYSYNREDHPMSLKPRKDWTEEELKEFSLM